MGAWPAQRARWSHWDEARITKLRQALRRPGRKLVLQHFDKRHEFRISPDNIQVWAEDAQVLIRRKYVVVHDRGLFDEAPAQSWICG